MIIPGDENTSHMVYTDSRIVLLNFPVGRSYADNFFFARDIFLLPRIIGNHVPLLSFSAFVSVQ